MELRTISRQDIISQLFRSPHGQLADYLLVGRQAATHEPDFLAHALAFDKRKGSIRDVQVGLPIVTLACKDYPQSLWENSLALLALLSPRDLLRAWNFSKGVPLTHRQEKRLERMIKGYLKARESCWPWWERTALNFRSALKTLYAVTYTKPCAVAQGVLFDNAPEMDSLFGQLKKCTVSNPEYVAGFLRQERIPFLVAQGVLGKRITEPEILVAIVDGMTPAQLIKNRKALEKWGVSDTASTRGAVTAATERARKGVRRDVALNATAAAQSVVEEDPTLAAELEAVQEAQLDVQQGIEGNWLILGDKSGSMQTAIETARLLASYMARQVRGQVLLVFFDVDPVAYDVTGKTYAEIRRITAGVNAGGGTSIGCGVVMAQAQEFQADGIAIVSDGGENHYPEFARMYDGYSRLLGKQPPVYLYHVLGEYDRLTERCAGLPYQRFEVSRSMDAYGLQALAQTMRVQRYSLIDEIMHVPLVTLEQALRVPKHWRDYVAV